MIFNMGGLNPKTVMPEFSYSGTYKLVDDGKNGTTQNWRLRFLTSGNFVPKWNMEIDAFLVGGGGSGTAGSGGGGGGGYTKTQKKISLTAGTTYEIKIGAGGAKVSSNDGAYNTGVSGKTGGTTSAFGYSASGGQGGQKADDTYHYGYGGKGGSGGGAGRAAGGSDGADGGDNKSATAGPGKGGKGQGTTTREFGASGETLYAGGGGGGNTKDGYNNGEIYAGGSGGGGGTCSSGSANTGGGGGGGLYRPSENGYKAGAGGSGIVIIRNAR